MNAISRTKRESGAVSLFIVIFAMLIITVITISFLRIMVTDQNQASAADLSQSAYDSAQAGVEDAKRALLYYQQECRTSQSACAAVKDILESDVCNKALVDTVVNAANVEEWHGSNPGEILVQQSTSSNDVALDQAYTCVKIQLESSRYEGTLTHQQSEMIPLISNSTFDTVTVRWFSREDVTGTAASALDVPNILPTADKLLLQQSNWSANRPSVMRAQMIQTGSTFTLDSFDTATSDQSNANTVFLFPTSAGGASNVEEFTAHDIRRANPASEPPADGRDDTPLATKCVTDVSAGGYACEMALRLPDPVGGGDRAAAFLRLTGFYNPTHFEVLLSVGGALDASESNIVKFRDVQPQIDATGRANDLFRRVVTKVNLYDTSFPYPGATIDITGNFCKDFSVTDTQYIAGSCTP